MSRRRHVPAALRDEVTEYSSLLRALRTSHTLDVTAHLTQPQQPSGVERHASEPEVFSATPSTSIGERNRARSEPESRDWKNRDQWTRWPMLLKDVPPPDWSLQDEIGSIVRQVLASVETDTVAEEDAKLDPDSDRDDEDAYMRHLTEHITPIIETRLESLFAIICAHTVARPDSMQNRIEPLTWHDLFNILSSPMASHLVDETVLQNMITRMQALDYNPPSNSKPNTVPSPSPTTALHRQSLTKSSRSRLNNLLSKHDAMLFQQTLPSPDDKYLSTYQLMSKKRRRRTGRKKQISEDGESEEDADTEGLDTTKETTVEGERWNDDDSSGWDGDP